MLPHQSPLPFLPTIPLLTSATQPAKAVSKVQFQRAKDSCDDWCCFKVGPSPSKKICFVCFNERSLKMMKMLFILS